jgi:Stress responsive A/B Barrel Domain
MLAHNVYFSLHDRSPEAIRQLLDACRTHLATRPGVVFFACGELASGCARPVNDRDFDVSLHLIFKAVDDHDRYQTADAEHQKFIDACRANWARVRVFDSVVGAGPRNG